MPWVSGKVTEHSRGSEGTNGDRSMEHAQSVILAVSAIHCCLQQTRHPENR